MAHSFVFGNVAKRKNSTLQGATTASYDVLFKSPTSLDNPVITLNHSGIFTYNYATYNGRYYFVTDVISRNNDLWEIHLKLDSLATYKSEILATTAYVIYDSVVNTELPDNRLPIKTTKSVQVSTVTCPFVPDGGCYILSLTGSNGTTGVYKVSENELSALIDDVSYIYDDFFVNGIPTPPVSPVPPTSGTIEDEIEFAGKMIEYFALCIRWIFNVVKTPISQIFGSGDIPENIRECRFIPFNVGTTGASNTIFLGTYQTQQSFGKLATDTVHRTVSVSIPWQASDFRRRSPYTEIYLYLPYIGMVKLSSENLAGESSLSVSYTLGMRDGSLIVTVSSGGEILGQYSGNVGASVPVGVSNVSLPKAAQSLLTGAAAIATENLAGVGMAALQFGNNITPNFSCIGGLEGVAGIATNQNITCYTVFHDTIAAPNQNLAVIGAPTMCSKSLGSLTGYVQCRDAHVSAAADLGILEEIDSYLNGGFYIE